MSTTWTFQYFSGANLRALRRELRKLLAAGRLESRRTYYDYYDSCHAPIETPDAPFEPIKERERWARDLKAGGPSIALIEPGLYQLSTGYSTYQLRLINRA